MQIIQLSSSKLDHERVSGSVTVTKHQKITMEKQSNSEQNIQPLSFKKVDTPFAVAAFASLVGSVFLWFVVDRGPGLFVGMWVPSIVGLWCVVRLILLTNIIRNQ